MFVYNFIMSLQHLIKCGGKVAPPASRSINTAQLLELTEVLSDGGGREGEKSTSSVRVKRYEERKDERSSQEGGGRIS